MENSIPGSRDILLGDEDENTSPNVCFPGERD